MFDELDSGAGGGVEELAPDDKLGGTLSEEIGCGVAFGFVDIEPADDLDFASFRGSGGGGGGSVSSTINTDVGIKALLGNCSIGAGVIAARFNLEAGGSAGAFTIRAGGSGASSEINTKVGFSKASFDELGAGGIAGAAKFNSESGESEGWFATLCVGAGVGSSGFLIARDGFAGRAGTEKFTSS